MSLIEEALRRVQQPNAPPRQGKPAPAAKPAASLPAQPAGQEQESVESIVHPWPVTPQPAGSEKTATKLFQSRFFSPLAVGLIALAMGGWILGLLWLNAGSFLRAKPAKKPASAAAKGSATTSSMVLSGVVIGNGEPYAVIDGRILSVGEQVNGASIEEITERTVRLRQANGTEMTLKVPR